MSDNGVILLILINKNKSDIQNYSNYRGIKIMSHTMKPQEKLWEKTNESRIKYKLNIF